MASNTQEVATRNGSRVAVLGSTGCLGRAIAAAFTREGAEVLAIARRRAPQVSDYRFLPLDVATTDPVWFARVLESEGVDTVVNATGGWGHTEEEMLYAHVRLVENLVTALEAKPSRTRVVHLGSIHEYGPIPEGSAIHEGIEPNPVTPYARTKLVGAQAVLRAAAEGAVEAVVLRAVNVCGPHTTAESFLGSVRQRLRMAAPGETVEINVADARRDFLDVRDVAAAVVRAAHAPVNGRVINLGRGEAVAMRELVSLLVSAAGFPPDSVKNQAAAVESKGGAWTQADPGLAAELLGWTAAVPLQESMRAMWEAGIEEAAQDT